MSLEDNKHRCVYCLKLLPKRQVTDDHVIPRSWYPLTTPANIPKWKAPCCESCNNKFSKSEQLLLIRFGLCLDPNNPASAGIVQKALDSINPDKANHEKDKRIRLKIRHKILRDTLEVAEYPETGVLPSFRRNWRIGSRTIVKVPVEELEPMIRKWTRGLHYCTVGRCIASDTDIDVFHLEDNVGNMLFKEIEPFVSKHIRGPGVTVMKASGGDDSKTTSIYQLTIWDQYRVWASVDEQL